MSFEPTALLNHIFVERRQQYDARDAILYALGIGLGRDPCDLNDLRFMNEMALSVVPSFAVTLASPGMWIRDPQFGVDFGKLVHFEQMAWFPEPLPPQAEIVGEARVISLTDRGDGKGAALVLERNIHDAQNGAHYCRLQQTLLLRGNGGFGGPPAPRTAGLIPESAPDAHAQYESSRRAALIYRLSGDWNPLHLDPAFAKAAGFDKPILQGLASYGMAGIGVSRALSKDPVTIVQLGCRFSGVVTPGDTLDLKIWNQTNGSAVFQAFVGDRKVLDEGIIRWKEKS
jgi:acyl dehydratase